MPKKYRVEMSLVEDASGSQVDSDTETIDFDNDTEAMEAFQEKVRAAHEKGKGGGNE
jgi:hypothetical protein